MKQKEGHPKDPRVQATGVMWGIVAAVAGIAIPLSRSIGSEAIILPMMALLSAGVATGFVWRTKSLLTRGGTSAEQDEQIETMRQTILELHEHVDLLERRIEEQTLQSRINQAATNVGGASASGSSPANRFEPPPIVTSRKENPPQASNPS